MSRLSGIDAFFLSLEQPAWPLHVGALMILDPSSVPGGLDFARYRSFVDERLPLLEVLRRRPVSVPLGLDRPVWEDDPDFRLDRHVRRVALPAPGDSRELADLVGALLEHGLDTRHPLWEAWFVEGLADGTVAVLFKVHHAAAGGFTGMRVLEHLCDLEASPPVPALPERAEQRAPSAAALAVRGALSLTTLPLRATRLAAPMARSAAGLVRFRLSGEWASATLPFRAPRTSFNGSVTRDRSVAYCSVPLADVKRVKNAFDTKVNDVVVSMLAGALRGYLEARGELSDTPLVAALPVAVHTPVEPGGPKEVLGNQLMMTVASMATDVADPVERLHAVHAATDGGKRLEQILGDDLFADLSALLPPATLHGFGRAYSGLRLAERHPPIFSLIVSNVPGPPTPLYSAGARIIDLFPLGPILDGSGLNVTVVSYVESVDFGFVACPTLVDDVWSIARGTEAALDELVARVPARRASVARPRTTSAHTGAATHP